MSNGEKAKQYRNNYTQWVFPVLKQALYYDKENTRIMNQQSIPPEQYAFFNEGIFKEKFFDIYREKEKAFQVMAFYANREGKKPYYLNELQKIPISEQLETMKKLTYEQYIQFYRFSVLNDDSSVFFPLFNTEQLNQFHEEFNHQWEKLIRSNALVKNTFGLYYEHPYTINDEKNSQNTTYDPKEFEKTWAKDLCFILNQLKKMRKENPMQYYEKWLQVKRARAEKRNLPTELKKLETVEKAFRERKEKTETQKETIR